jgi:hypothetical protein
MQNGHSSYASQTIYEEVRKVNARLTLIEEALEEVITKGLPEVKIQKKEDERNRTISPGDEARKLRNTRGTQECLSTRL